MVTLSLFLFNLLPLPLLDGAQFLDALLEMVPESGDNELDDIELGDFGRSRAISRSGTTWRNPCKQVVQTITLVSVGLALFAGMVKTLRA